MAVTPVDISINSSAVPTLTLAAGSAGGVAAASTIDPVNDYMLIYTHSLTATQGINRNTLLGITGSPVGTTDTQTLSNKTFGNTNAFTTLDSSFTLQNSSDNTKQGVFSLSGLTTGTTRTYSFPNYNATLASLAGTETLTNKTITSPTINSPTITNASITADTISGYTISNAGTIYGMSVSGGVLASAALVGSVNSAAIASGALSPTKTANPYKFSAYRNASFNTGNGSDALVTFDTETFDTGSNYSTSTGKFTAPVAGFYWFTATISGTSATYIIVNLYKNGAAILHGYELLSSGGSSASGVNGFLQLSANDYIQVYCQTASGAAGGTGSGLSYFQGFLVSAT